MEEEEGAIGAELVESVPEPRSESEEELAVTEGDVSSEESASDDEGCSGDVYLVMRVLCFGN